ncbi:MAG: hypothetical protein M1828_005527 [Chrysothrix sp. TS-e1954]|nr:MAG: hypothetical protein M1828_005527 [Chrysothrix sp. TS-e1954]
MNPPDPPRCSLLNLPGELRDLIYRELLTSSAGPDRTFGKGSGICINVLGTCGNIYREALPILTDTRHTLIFDPQSGPVLWNVISPSHIRSLKRIKLVIRYQTANRGDYEIEMLPINPLYSFTEALGLTLRHSSGLEELLIELENKEQRKRGPKRLRSELVSHQMQNLLRPFAFLPEKTKVSVSGFDTIDFADMFDGMRSSYAGKELPFWNLLYAGLGARPDETLHQTQETI